MASRSASGALSNTPVVDDAGQVAYIIHRVEDVTEFVRLRQQRTDQERQTDELRLRAAAMEAEVFVRAQEVAEANRQLQAANVVLNRSSEKARELDELKSQFFANVSHELRTPLALIVGPTEQALAALDADSPARAHLEVIGRNGRLLLKQVNDLLDLSAFDAGKLDVRLRHGDLAGLTRLVASNFDSLASERRVDYVVDAPQPLATDLDVDKIERVLVNLLANAFKFTPTDGRIRCSVRDTGDGTATVEVADSGPGIPTHQRDAVFERFRQLDGGTDRRFGGTGLGLAIASDFVSLHAGTITVAEAPEGGALFTIRLPIRSTAAPVEDHVPAAASRVAVEGLSPIPEEPREPAEPSLPRALVVEDNVDMRRFIAEALRPRFQVVSAADGREGLTMAIEVEPDLIVTDLMMPGFSGAALLRDLRANPIFDDIPIIVLTAKADDQVRAGILADGANDVLTKPFAVAELQARAANHVRMRRTLARRSSRLEAIIAGSPIATIILNEAGIVEFWNPAASELFGLNPSESWAMIGR